MMFFEKRHFCVLCGAYKGASQMQMIHNEIGICSHCLGKLPILRDNCFEGSGNIKAVFSLFMYDGAVKEAVKQYKFSGQRLYGELFGSIMAEKLSSVETLKDCDCIIPVPLHPKRLEERGYNQSEILAKTISEKLEIPMITDALFRIKETQRQSALKGLARIENVKNAFFAYGEAVKDKRIILVDDICTMGETLKACEAALKTGGAEDVFATTLCISPHKDKYFRL